MKYCEECGAQLDPSDKYCPECGMSQENIHRDDIKFCEECGTEFEEGESFCSNCGCPKQSSSANTPAAYQDLTTQANALESKNINARDFDDRYEYSVDEDTETGYKKSPKVSKVVLIVLLVVAVVALSVFLIMYFTGEKNYSAQVAESVTVTEATETSTAPTNAMQAETEPTETTEPPTQPDETVPKEDGYILEYSNTRILTDSDLYYLSDRELELARNEIYARHGRLFNTDYIQQYFNTRSWYHGTVSPDEFDDSVLNDIEKYNIDFIQEYEENRSSDTFNSNSVPNNYYTPEDDYYYNDQSTQETEPEVDVKTVNVKGVEFNYVNSYKYEAKYTGGVIDYNINLDIKYCEPSEYMSDNDRIVGISSSTGMYDESEIGSLYKSAGYNDFAVFEVKVSGDYIDEFYGYNNIEFRKYNHAGAVLKNIATQVTDYEMLYLDPDEGTINEKFYIGFFTSEVGRVDFKILGVGPNGLGEW